MDKTVRYYNGKPLTQEQLDKLIKLRDGDFLSAYQDYQAWSGVSGSVAQDVRWDMASGSDYTAKTRFIRCPYCGTRNPNLSTIYYCQSCGGPLEE